MIERIIILTLVSIGICCTMWEGNIFEKFGNWIEKKVGVWLAKPLGQCYLCTTFWVSLVICLCVGWEWWLCVPAMGLSAVISLLQPSEPPPHDTNHKIKIDKDGILPYETKQFKRD